MGLSSSTLPAAVRHSVTVPRACDSSDTLRLGAVARVGIGYVTGANDFFHLRPSEAERAQIPERLLCPTVRNGRCLTRVAIPKATVEAWRRRDEPILLLRLEHSDSGSPGGQADLDSSPGRKARETYKCRNRDPWYVVPDVTTPDAFLSYMSGDHPCLSLPTTPSAWPRIPFMSSN